MGVWLKGRWAVREGLLVVVGSEGGGVVGSARRRAPRPAPACRGGGGSREGGEGEDETRVWEHTYEDVMRKSISMCSNLHIVYEEIFF